MQIEKSPAPLQTAAREIFDHVRWLCGIEPRLEPSNGWYRCDNRDGAPWAHLYLLGDRARKNPPRSLLAVAPASATLDDSNSFECDYWYGKPARCCLAKAAASEELERLKTFLKIAHTNKR